MAVIPVSADAILPNVVFRTLHPKNHPTNQALYNQTLMKFRMDSDSHYFFSFLFFSIVPLACHRMVFTMSAFSLSGKSFFVETTFYRGISPEENSHLLNPHLLKTI